MIKVMIVDDQKLFRESLKTIIVQDENLEVIACAGDGQEAFELCGSLPPDVVLMDIKMPGCDGIQGTKLIKEKYPAIKVVMLTMFDDEVGLYKELGNKVDGYILKDISPADLVLAIKNTSQGFVTISKKAYQTIIGELDKLREEANEEQEKQDNPLILNLKENEKKIIQLIAEGKNNKEIASILFLSEGRIKNIISELLTRLQLKNRYELMHFAYENLLVK